MTEKGHELKIKWDGGGDSGWCEFLIDELGEYFHCRYWEQSEDNTENQ